MYIGIDPGWASFGISLINSKGEITRKDNFIPRDYGLTDIHELIFIPTFRRNNGFSTLFADFFQNRVQSLGIKRSHIGLIGALRFALFQNLRKLREYIVHCGIYLL